MVRCGRFHPSHHVEHVTYLLVVLIWYRILLFRQEVQEVEQELRRPQNVSEVIGWLGLN
jgi:hypothetical protein